MEGYERASFWWLLSLVLGSVLFLIAYAVGANHTVAAMLSLLPVVYLGGFVTAMFVNVLQDDYRRLKFDYDRLLKRIEDLESRQKG